MRFLCNPLRYVFKLIGFSLKARPKMRLFSEILKILNKTLVFLSVFITLIIISDLTISIRSTVLKKGVCRKVYISYLNY